MGRSRALSISLDIFSKLSGLFNLKKRKLGWAGGTDVISVNKYLMGENEDEGARLFSVVLSDRRQ